MGQAADTNIASPRFIRIRTDDWPESDRLTMFRENVGRDRVRVEPVAGEAFRIDGQLMKLPRLGLVSVRRSALRSDFADGSDRLMINLGGDSLAAQAGREFVLQRGDAIGFGGADVGSFTTPETGRIATLEFPNGGLGSMLGDPGHSMARRLPARAPALLLLRRYLNALFKSDALDSPDLRPIATAHLHDLAALALGANSRAEEMAQGRGVRAARLQAIKADVLGRLPEEVTIGQIAAHHQLTARYIRMLFAVEGTTFTDFVRDARLDRAHRMLLNRAFDRRLISEIAFEVGFNDLSYFNRAFRRRFDETPSEARELRS
ncbi:MAG TPA: AraC family transcriptional regulator [Sphingomicrobium sp.]